MKTLTHAQLSAYIGESAFAGNAYTANEQFVPALPMPGTRTGISRHRVPEAQVMDPDAYLFFTPYAVSAFSRKTRRRIEFPWSATVFSRQYRDAVETDGEYIMSTIGPRIEKLRAKLDKVEGTLFSRWSPSDATTGILIDYRGLWHSPSAARLRTLNWALEGLRVLNDQYAETTAERITRLASIGKAIQEGMPLDYAREMGRL